MDALRSTLQPILQPITHNLPGPIQDLGTSIIGPDCYKALILDIDVENTECIKLGISKGLGIGIIGASSIVKVPQILKLVSSQSAAGVSFLSYVLETSAYLITLAYNFRNEFPFSTYGETALILGQNVVICVLLLNYSGRAPLAAVFVALLAAAAGALFTTGVIDMKVLSYLQAGAGVLGVASKVPQILAIAQQGGTGQLSAFTVRLRRIASMLSKLHPTNEFLPLGLQLPRRLAFPNLYYPPRGRRQAHPLRLRLWICPQRHPHRPDDLLLERSLRKGQGQAEGCSRQGRCRSLAGRQVDCYYYQEEPDYSSPRLDDMFTTCFSTSFIIINS